MYIPWCTQGLKLGALAFVPQSGWYDEKTIAVETPVGL
jgi:hypothetical protein